MNRSIRPALMMLLAGLALAIALAACGGGNSSSSSTSEEATSSTEDASSTSSSNEEGSSGDAVAEAKAELAPFVGQPSPFPVTEDLKELPKGATVDYMDCGAPYCSLIFEALTPAAEMMGVKLERIKAGFAANTVSAAFDTAVTNKPDAVIITAIEPALYTKQLKDLQDLEIPVVTVGVTSAEEFGIESPQFGKQAIELDGRLQADYVALEFGPDSNVGFFGVPELALTKVTEEAFQEQLERVCPTCKVEFFPVPVADLGTKSATDVVSALQANPDVNVVLMNSGEIAIGLPAALKQAGLDVKTMSGGAGPENLQMLKEGSETASFATDLPVTAFTLMDVAAREMAGQKVTGAEAEGAGVQQFLTKEDITFDPSHGWNGYPDVVERFSKLWGLEG